ncbi:MAG: AAA family ATPase [Hyphomonadaceae bacterium]|jgi:hypothetical protein|nr:AAA family ATPase [Hyphomonadaceae bacterium]
MGDIISFVGQKGGTGKSTLARAFAVEAAKRDQGVVIADLDEAQRTSWDWGQRRSANGLQPAIAVERVPRLQVFTRAADIDLLVVDAPGWADASTLWLAQGSQLTVLPTGGTVDDLRRWDFEMVRAAIESQNSARKRVAPNGMPGPETSSTLLQTTRPAMRSGHSHRASSGDQPALRAFLFKLGSSLMRTPSISARTSLRSSIRLMTLMSSLFSRSAARCMVGCMRA